MVRKVILGPRRFTNSSVHRGIGSAEMEEVMSIVGVLAPDDAIFVTRQAFHDDGVGLEDLLTLRRSLLLGLPNYVTLLEDVKKRGVWVYRRPDGAKSRAIGPAKEEEIRSRPLGL
jgi:hypothetical protein